MASKPTQRSLEYLRGEGWLVGIVETWNMGAKIRQDLFGFADLVAVHPGKVGTYYVQVTSGGNLAARRTKILAEPRAHQILTCGNRVLLHGWRKVKKKKKDGSWSKVYQYELRHEEVTLDQFPKDVRWVSHEDDKARAKVVKEDRKLSEKLKTEAAAEKAAGLR